jgi:phosphate-selective porin OprO and OprP
MPHRLSPIAAPARRAVALIAAMAAIVSTSLHAQTRPQAASPSNAAAGPVLSWDWSGRVQIDHSSFEGVYSRDGGSRSATYLRRGDVSGQLRWGPQWRAGATLQMDSDGKVELDLASVAYLPYDGLRLAAGRIDPDFGHDNAMSSSWSHGIERSAIWDLTSEVHDANGGVGLRADAHGEGWHASAGLYDLRERTAFIGRGVWLPLTQKGRVLQLGASVASSRGASDDGRIRSRLGLRGVSEDALGRRSTLADAVRQPQFYEGDRQFAVEAAWQHGAFLLLAEGLSRRLDARAGAPSRSASGMTATVAWSPTGQSRQHSEEAARFGRPERAGTPWGVWEVFYRFDRLAAKDGLDGTRKATVHTLGTSWIADENWRVLVNVHRATSDDPNPVDQRDGAGWALRLQGTF